MPICDCCVEEKTEEECSRIGSLCICLVCKGNKKLLEDLKKDCEEALQLDITTSSSRWQYWRDCVAALEELL